MMITIIDEDADATINHVWW